MKICVMVQRDDDLFGHTRTVDRFEHAKREAGALMDDTATSVHRVPQWTRAALHDCVVSRGAFVDTKILVQAHAADDRERRAAARSLLQTLWDSGEGLLSTQVLQEFYAVATRKPQPALAKVSATAVVAKYSEWCRVDTDSLLIVSASKLEAEQSLAFRDALIIESALRAGAKTLLSEDMQHGRCFGDLRIENPFRAE